MQKPYACLCKPYTWITHIWKFRLVFGWASASALGHRIYVYWLTRCPSMLSHRKSAEKESEWEREEYIVVVFSVINAVACLSRLVAKSYKCHPLTSTFLNSAKTFPIPSIFHSLSLSPFLFPSFLALSSSSSSSPSSSSHFFFFWRSKMGLLKQLLWCWLGSFRYR